MNFSAPTVRRVPASRFRWALGIGLSLAVAASLASTLQVERAVTDAGTPAPTSDAPATSTDTLAARATPIEPAAGVTALESAPVRAARGPARPYGPAAAATPAGAVATLPRSEPARVRIPAIGVDSELVSLGLQPDGRMEVPAGAFPAGWFTGAPTPGELGPAVLAGHVDHSGTAGVFVHLRDLQPGDRVEVDRRDGGTATFRVTHVEQHPKDAFPTAAVYGDIDHAGLRLITCGGEFDRRVRSYEDNIVVFAELDTATEAAA